MAKKDERLKLISEVLNGIKVPCQSVFSVEDVYVHAVGSLLCQQVIKLYAWEIPFQKQIVDIREAELRILRKSRIVDIAATLTWYTAPFLVSCIDTIPNWLDVEP